MSHQCQDQLAKNQPGLTFMNFSVRRKCQPTLQNWSFFLKEPKLISQFGNLLVQLKPAFSGSRLDFLGSIYIYIWYIYIPCALTRECEDYLLWSLIVHPFLTCLKGVRKTTLKGLRETCQNWKVARDAFASRPLIPPVRAARYDVFRCHSLSPN